MIDVQKNFSEAKQERTAKRQPRKETCSKLINQLDQAGPTCYTFALSVADFAKKLKWCSLTSTGCFFKCISLSAFDTTSHQNWNSDPILFYFSGKNQVDEIKRFYATLEGTKKTSQ